MIRIISIVVATLLFCYIVFVSFFFREIRQDSICQDLQVVVKDSLDKHFVSESDLVSILKKAGLDPIKRSMADVNTDRIETELLKNEMIAQVEAYKTPSGIIKLEVMQKMPILRIMGVRGSYYVDNLGTTMPISRRYAAHVPIVSGYVEKELAVTDLYKFALFLQENEFWNDQIEQIYVYPDNDIELIPRVGNHRIMLGTLDEFEEKLANLKLFYEQAIPKVGWEKYSMINLKDDMAYTDFIAAIDLGTSHMVGMVGTKNATGALSIIAYEVENSGTCIRRGCVYNVKETASKIKRLILKLENKLGGAKIGQVYVGLGGQSLRSIEHTVCKVLGTEGVVTEEIIDSLYQECKDYRPDMLTVLDVVSPSYFLDDKPESNPVGVPCSRIEARYKLIVGRPSLKLNIVNSISEQAKIEIAGILVSPLALGDVVLSDNEKDLGCALIGFGAGVTTISVYKGGKLASLSVVPFGGNLITKDITNLRVVESEAERLKITYGSAKADRDNDMTIQVSLADGMGLREIKLAELNGVIEARMDEILENVYARLEATGLMSVLGAGIVITGGGAALKNLPAVMSERLKMEVRYSAVRKGVVASGDLVVASNPEYAVAVGLLAKGTKNCALYIPPKPEPKIEPVVEPEPTVEPTPEPEPVKEKPKKEKKKGPGLFGRLTKGIDTFGKTLFDDDDNESK